MWAYKSMLECSADNDPSMAVSLGHFVLQAPVALGHNAWYEWIMHLMGTYSHRLMVSVCGTTTMFTVQS